MKTTLNLMYLNCHSGSKENGEIYYYGSFLEPVSNKTINLYFNNMDWLKKLEPRKDYSIPVDFYLSSMINNQNQRVNVWRLKVLESELK